MTESKSKTIGFAWCDGGDPEDGGWQFDETGTSIDGYTMAYDCNSRREALDNGVPASVCDQYEADGHDYSQNEYGLFSWLQEHPALFRTDEGPDA